jgi:probable phosphomutase (TIGR03848 family)
MTTMLWVRHGETDWIGTRLAGRQPGIHLNEKGRRQAGEVAQMLAPLSIEAFYASPLERALETAEPAARAAGKPVQAMDNLQEVDFGELSGRTFEELRELPIWKQVRRQPSSVEFPGGETLLNVQRRAVAALAEICEGHPRGVVAVFSHSDTIRLMLCHILQIPLDFYPRLVIDPASVSLVLKNDKAQRILGINFPPGTPLSIQPE